MVLLPMCGVKRGRSRPFTIMEGRKVHVISGLRADFGEQCAVHPVYDGSVHFAGSTEHLAVILELRDKDVLNLQISSRMQQRHGVEEALQGAGAQMEPL